MRDMIRTAYSDVSVAETGEEAAAMLIAGFAGAEAGKYTQGNPEWLQLTVFIIVVYFVLISVLALLKAILHYPETA